MNNRLLITILIAILLITGTISAIYFAKGYRFNPDKGKVMGTGLLVANSFPTGASVYLNDKLTTATDNTLNLPPGDYKVKISKDGYLSWEKNLILKAELVTQTNVRLFPSVPDLKSLTYTGAANLTPSPDGEKIAYVVASASASPANGLWALNLTPKPLAFSRDTVQLAKNTINFDFNAATLIWSPDSKQLLAINNNYSYLLAADKFNDLTTMGDISTRLTLILTDWENQINLKNQEKLAKLPEFMQTIVKNNVDNIYFSPDEEKIMYTATASAALPEGLVQSLPSSNTQPQARNIEAGKIYVYDLKEDKNFYITDRNLAPANDKLKTGKTVKTSPTEKSLLESRLSNLANIYSPLKIQSVQWFPSSNHLITIDNNKIVVLEYDGTNKNAVYAGPFTENFVYPWPDGSKLIILTNLNPDSSLPPNLYAIDLK